MEAGALFVVFFHSSLVILSSFDIRHSSFESGAPAPRVTFDSFARMFLGGEIRSAQRCTGTGGPCRSEPLPDCLRHRSGHSFPLDHAGAAISVARDPWTSARDDHLGHSL